MTKGHWRRMRSINDSFKSRYPFRVNGGTGTPRKDGSGGYSRKRRKRGG